MQKQKKKRRLPPLKIEAIKKGRGAPTKLDSEKMKPRTLNMDDAMWNRFTDEAAKRKIDISVLGRQVFEWFFTVIDTKRADVEGSALFDDTLSSGKGE